MASIADFLRAPSFGLAATALLVIGLFSPTVFNSVEKGETFRGSEVTYASNSATVVLITEEPEIRQLLEKSGLFEMDSVIETSDPLVAASIQTAKLLVDINGGAMVGYNAESREVVVDQLPANRSEFAERIAVAFGALQ